MFPLMKKLFAREVEAPRPAPSIRDLTFERYATIPTDKATVDDIAHCFRLLLGRNPHPVEWTGHISRVGEDLGNVVSSYLSSAEFSARNLLKSPDADRITVTDYDGFSIFSHMDDLSIGVYVAAKNYEPHVQAVFRSFLKPGMTVLDVGANIGFFSLFSASLVGEEGRVISVEPNTGNVKLLEASRRKSGFGHLEVHCVAADAKPGLLILNTSHSNGTVRAIDDVQNLLSSTVVPAQTLDSIVAGRKVDFVKLDVEGAEFKAIQGAHNTLAHSKPVIVSEFSPPGIPEGGEAYLSLLLDHGYDLGVVADDGSVTPYGSDRDGVIKAFWEKNLDHIDIVATPR